MAGRAGSAEDKRANMLVWQDAERRLWNDPTLTLDEGYFEQNFGRDEALIAERMHFIESPDGEVIASTTAWYARAVESWRGVPFPGGGPAALGAQDGDPKGTRGVVHNVGMKSEYAGRGLSKPLLTAVLLRLRELGHVDCHLNTSTGRLEAINLYVKYGFLPEARTDEEYRAWRELQPLLRERFVAPFRSPSSRL